MKKIVPVLCGLIIAILISSGAIVYNLKSDYTHNEIKAEETISTLRMDLYHCELLKDSFRYELNNLYDKTHPQQSIRDILKGAFKISDNDKKKNTVYAFVEIYVTREKRDTDPDHLMETYVSDVFELSDSSDDDLARATDAEVHNAHIWQEEECKLLPIIRHYNTYSDASNERRSFIYKIHGTKTF